MSTKTFFPAVKWMFLLMVFSLGAVGVQAQGVLNFATAAGGTGGTVNAPATNAFVGCCVVPPLNGTRPSGAGYLAQLYVGPAGIADASLLTTNGVGGAPAPFGTGGQAGFVIAGTRTILGYAPGTTITVQIRAWNVLGGVASWEAVPVEFRTFISGPGAPNLIQLTLGDGVGTTPNLVGMQTYLIPFDNVPEPSTWALLALGGVVFAARLRRRRE